MNYEWKKLNSRKRLVMLKYRKTTVHTGPQATKPDVMKNIKEKESLENKTKYSLARFIVFPLGGNGL